MSAQEADTPALKDVFAGRFLVGAALGSRIVTDASHPAHPLVARHFDSITPTNQLKWEPYNPTPGVLVLEPVDAFVAFGEQHDLNIVGHVLFWHQQTPEWVFLGDDGGTVSRDVLLGRMRDRVRQLAARYGSRIHAWDVVNETFEDDGRLRDSEWTRVLGADFIAEAFRIAKEELPAETVLLYNDYSMFHRGRREAVVRMIHDLRGRGLRIDAVGMQGHWALRFPPIEQIEESIVAFGNAGVRVHITELDIEMLPRRRGGAGADLNERGALASGNNPYVDGLPSDVQQELGQRYAEVFELFLKHSDLIDRVTFWGVTDGDSWLNNWPVRGRTNHPLLFDREGNPKPAFHAVIETGSSPAPAAAHD